MLRTTSLSTPGVTLIQSARLFQTPMTQPVTAKPKSMPAEHQELFNDVQSIKILLKEFQCNLNPPEVSNVYQRNPIQRPWSTTTPQVYLGAPPASQGALPRSMVRFDPGSFAKTQASRRPILETVTETSGLTLTEEDINLDPHCDAPPIPKKGQKAPPLEVRELQEQLQQLKLGPTVSSTPLRTPRTTRGAKDIICI